MFSQSDYAELLWSEYRKEIESNVDFSNERLLTRDLLADTELVKWKLSPERVDEIIFLMTHDHRNQGNELFSSALPSGFTYLGQLLTHDIVKSTNSAGDGRIEGVEQTEVADLDCIYFKDINFKDDESNRVIDNQGKFRKDPTCSSDACFFDLLRDKNRKAIIPDQRNDENKIISQLHRVFQLFHNYLVDQLEGEREEKYELAKTVVTLVYQKSIENEFLKGVIYDPVYKEVVKNKQRYLLDAAIPRDKFKISLEFSHAVFRFGHSMVMNRYYLNGSALSSKSKKISSLLNRRKNEALRDEHFIQWGRFFFSESNIYRHRNHAARIGLRLAENLKENFHSQKFNNQRLDKLHSAELKNIRSSSSHGKRSLAHQRSHLIHADLVESRKVPTGGEIVRALLEKQPEGFSELEFPTLREYQELIHFKISHLGGTTSSLGSIDVINRQEEPSPRNIDFETAPLWLFILSESIAKFNGNSEVEYEKLGPLGSLIVAETVMQSIKCAEISIYSEERDLGELEAEYSAISKSESIMQEIFKRLFY